MSKKGFQRVILYARQIRANQDINETLQHLVDFLAKQGLKTYIDKDTAAIFDLKIAVLPREQINTATDLLLVVGGDGSLLAAAQIALDFNIPVIGINRGYLGFLTDIPPQEFTKPLEEVLNGKYRSEYRTLLQMQIGALKQRALNDIVLSRGNETRLITFDVYIDEQFVSHYRADGLILATPTGSTAYSMSAGGPILHPNLEATVMVPMFSHSLSSRPLVFASSSQIELHISPENDNAVQISCDGNKSQLIKPGQKIIINKSPQKLHLLHPCDYHYYETLNNKLGWGSTG